MKKTVTLALTLALVLGLLSGCANNDTPVSYTHLDVYKRQLLDTAFDVSPTLIGTRVNNVLIRSFDEIGDYFAACHPDAVSYTHLDVYKRKRLPSAVLS